MPSTATADVPAEAPMFGVVINHFSTRDIAHLRTSTLFAASLSQQDPLVREVVVVDGSPEPDDRLRHDVEALGVRYHHAGRMLGFAAGYNVGAGLITAPWLVLSASDVYPALDLYSTARDFIGQADRPIGCIIPRLTSADLPIQESRRAPSSVCVVPLMTLNLNIFERTTFHELGGVPECYSGGFNDVEMSVRIRDSGRAIFMLPTRCNHFGSLTLASAASNYRYLEDRATFFARFPDLARLGYFWDIDVARLCSGRLRLLLRSVGALCPARWRLGALHRILKAVPAIQRWRRPAAPE